MHILIHKRILMHDGERPMNEHTLPDERRTQIIHLLETEGKVTAPSLSHRLGVSVDTIRRDLIQLASAGQLTKVHGGALPCSPATEPYRMRKRQNSEAKVQLAKRAAQFVQSGHIVFMDNGTTVEETARQLPLDLVATVVTNSLAIASALHRHRTVKVIMTGGILDSDSMSLSGSAAVETLRDIRADICILGVCSIDPEAGMTGTGFEENDIKRQMIKNAHKIVVPVTTDKLGTAAPYVIASVECIDHLIVEGSTSEYELEPYRKRGIHIEKGDQ